MEFLEFKKILQKHFENILKNQTSIFVVDLDKEILWNLYLDSFPKGTNELFRERREFDCSCCRHFIKAVGNIVIINPDYSLTSIWDFKTNDDKYQVVINALSNYVKSCKIKDIFKTKESYFGTDFNQELLEDNTVRTWHHFRLNLPKNFVSITNSTIDTIVAEFRDSKNVFRRSLEEISKDAIETVVELISQKSLYKGDEWKKVLDQFLFLKIEYDKLTEEQKDIFCWLKSSQLGGVISRIRNHSMGVLLTDVSNNMDIDTAVSRYEKIVAPSNYKRPKAIITEGMKKQALKTIEENGLKDSLSRRFANINDITINNVLFANRDIKSKLISDDPFQKLQEYVTTDNKSRHFDRVEEVNIEVFIKDILPKVSNIEVYLENRHESNLVSLIAPSIANSKIMFKWANGFCWAYNGNITDSMKEIVKALGGNVDGVLRFSIQWNETGKNSNDLDAHCIEPNGNKIYYMNKKMRHLSSGMLDTDIMVPGNNVAAENIIYTHKERMQEGIYQLLVHNFTDRRGIGFKAEVEFDDQIYSYEYNKSMKLKEYIMVAEVKYSKKEGFKIIKSLDGTTSSKTIWNLQTNNFQPVNVIMLSPNYWDEQNGVGNKHYFFMLNNCIRSDSPNGFFNEFLVNDLMKHKNAFEALGNIMKVQPSNEQLSGLGFSSQRNSIIVKLEGSFSRVIKLTF